MSESARDCGCRPDEPCDCEFVCACECGGLVYGVRAFGFLWTRCSRCTPVQEVRLPPPAGHHHPAPGGQSP